VRRIRFVLSAGLAAPMVLEANAFVVNPLFPTFVQNYGAFAHGDVAVVELVDPLPASIDTYPLFTGSDEFNRETRHYGHGDPGVGNKGATGEASFFVAHTGLNMYEQTLEPFLGDGIEDQLLFDFDSGGRKHNAMAWWFSSKFACRAGNPNNPAQAQDAQCTTFKDGSYPDYKGFGRLEVGVSPGDSGGPGFIDGKIAGVHSFGFTHFCQGVTDGTDFTCGLDSSYGEMSGDTRVSKYAGWIHDVLDGSVTTTTLPEPPVGAAASARTASTVRAPQRARAFIDGVFSGTWQAPVGSL